MDSSDGELPPPVSGKESQEIAGAAPPAEEKEPLPEKSLAQKEAPIRLSPAKALQPLAKQKKDQEAVLPVLAQTHREEQRPSSQSSRETAEGKPSAYEQARKEHRAELWQRARE